MGAYKRHLFVAQSPTVACGRRKANVIATAKRNEVTCSLCRTEMEAEVLVQAPPEVRQEVRP